MRYLEGKEEADALEFILMSAEVAKLATCLRSKCGSVVVKENKIIGFGYNSPANDDESQRRCLNEKDSYDKKITDKTCCVHAEQRAIMNSLKFSPDDIQGSRLYFIRLDNDDMPAKAGEPYCTACSKMALDAGIEEFVLWHDKGIAVYGTREYNDLSYQFKG